MRAFDRLRTVRGSGRIGLILTLIVVAAIIYALVKFVPLRIQKAELSDYIEEKGRNTVALAGTIESLQEEILAYAQREGIPLTEDGLTIDNSDRTLKIRARYTVVQSLIGGKEWRHEFDVEREIPKI